MIMKITNDNFKIKYDKTKPDGTPRKLLDISLAKKYNWKPKFDLMEALKITVQDFKKIMEIIKKLNFKFILLFFFIAFFIPGGSSYFLNGFPVNGKVETLFLIFFSNNYF